MTNSKTPGTRLTVFGLVNENKDISKDKYELLSLLISRSLLSERQKSSHTSRERAQDKVRVYRYNYKYKL